MRRQGEEVVFPTQELLPLGPSLERRPQEVRGHVGELRCVSVAADGRQQQLVAALLLSQVVLRLATGAGPGQGAGSGLEYTQE